MKSRQFVVVAGLVLALGMAAWWTSSSAQDAAQPAPARLGDDETGRLPPGFAAVIKRSQRAQIYAVQERYLRQIEELQKQITALEKKRDEEITNLLTPEQRQALAIILKLREDERKEEAQARAAATESKTN